MSPTYPKRTETTTQCVMMLFFLAKPQDLWRLMISFLSQDSTSASRCISILLSFVIHYIGRKSADWEWLRIKPQRNRIGPTMWAVNVMLVEFSADWRKSVKHFNLAVERSVSSIINVALWIPPILCVPCPPTNIKLSICTLEQLLTLSTECNV